MRARVESGAIDAGMILPEGIDDAIARGETPTVTVFVGGESLASNRITLAAALSAVLREEAGHELPVELVEVPLGEEAALPVKVRVIPLLIIYAIMIGGTTLPATLLLDEVEKRTVSAVMVTPATLGEVVMAKAIVGFSMSFLMGIAILLMNGVFVGATGLLVLFIALGALLAVSFGLLIGEVSGDLNTAFTYVKLVGVLLAGPAFLYFFPQVPEWVSRLFPTYYLLNPIIEISQNAAGFADVWLDAAVLLVFIVVFMAATIAAARRLALRV